LVDVEENERRRRETSSRKKVAEVSAGDVSSKIAFVPL
jgi:hypothetical protein